MNRGTSKFRFGPVRQEAGSKHVRQGDLLEAVNVRQTAKAGVYAKRKAFVRTAQTGGPGVPETVLPGQSGNSLMRDTSDRLWARSNATNAWSLMGAHSRPWPEVTTVQSNLYTTPQPFSCLVGASLWAFALKTNAYEFSIIDAASGVVTGAKVTVTATGIVNASAAYDGTYVWIFWVDNGANGTVRCHRITASTPTVAPTATDYYSFPSSPVNVSLVALQQVQARYFSTTNRIMVVACGGRYTGSLYKRACMHSVLNPSTGLASVAAGETAQVSYAYSGATGPYTISGLCILDGQTGSGSQWFYTYVNWDTASTQQLCIVEVTNGVTSSFTTNPITYAQGPSVDAVYSCAGYADQPNLRQYILITWQTAASHGSDFWQLNNRVPSWGGAYGTHSTNLPTQWGASGFAQVGAQWYLVVGNDDWSRFRTPMGSEGNSIQRCLRVIQFTPSTTAALGAFKLVAQYQMGNGSAVLFNASAAITFASGTPPVACCAPPVHVVGNKIVSAVSIASVVTGYVDLALSTIDTAKVYGKSVQAMGMGFAPGNIPIAWSGSTPPHEIAPMDFPAFLTQTGGAGTDFSIAAAVYAIYDNNGVVWRSSPTILSATIGHGAALSVPEPTVTGNTSVVVEFYLGINGTPKLQSVVSYTPGSGVPVFTTPAVANMVNGEILYTTGNALSHTWPVPCQAMGVWGNRLFAAQKNTLWYSKELEPGFGPLFNEILRAAWNDERNDITAIAPVDWNYLGIASADQVAVISGQGPDGNGNGNYVIKTLPSWTGVAAGGVAIQGDKGMYYQNPATGRIMCVQPSLQVLEAAGGAYDYSSYAFSVAAWYESENLMVFFAPASGAAIAIDYQHPKDVAPFGQVYLWTFAAGFVPAAACRDDLGLLVLSSQGHVYRPTTTQWVDDNANGTTDTYRMKLATAELQMGDLQGGFTVAKVQTLLTMRGASGVSIDVYPGYASRTAADSRVTSAPIDLPSPVNSGDAESIMTRPANCARIESIGVVILEKAGVTTQSFEFEGFAVEYTSNGRLLRPGEGRVI